MSKRVDPKIKHYKATFEVMANLGLAIPCQKLDHVALQKEYRERAKRGREQMIDFQAWLVSFFGYSYSTAVQVRRRVWAAIQETEGEPWRKLDDPRLSWSYRDKLTTDLKKWAAFMFADNRGYGAMECAEALLERCPDKTVTIQDLVARSLGRSGRGRRGGRVRKERQG